MDIVICAIQKNKKTDQLTFAGAKNNLFIYSSLQKTINKYKGSRKMIGGKEGRSNSIRFTEITLSISKGDILYLMTDGIIDQNNEERKRFGTQNLLDLITSIVDQPMQYQQLKIEEALDNFQSKENQRDDITVIGIKI